MTGEEALKIIETYNYWNVAEEITGNTCVNPVYIETKKQYSEAQNLLLKDLEVIEIIKEHPSLLCCFAYDGIWTWEQYQEYYSDEDKEFIGATQEEFNRIKEWLKNDK